jgi:hypothetical protein
MATNFVLTTVARIGSPAPVGAYLAAVDQAPTGSWAEVVFTPAAGGHPLRTRERLLLVTADADVRLAIAAAAPGAGEPGLLVLADTSREIAFAESDRLWIK